MFRFVGHHSHQMRNDGTSGCGVQVNFLQTSKQGMNGGCSRLSTMDDCPKSQERSKQVKVEHLVPLP